MHDNGKSAQYRLSKKSCLGKPYLCFYLWAATAAAAVWRHWCHWLAGTIQVTVVTSPPVIRVIPCCITAFSTECHPHNLNKNVEIPMTSLNNRHTGMYE
jgi:hypothetical protein